VGRISGIVGKGGKNVADDVRTLQTLLNKHASTVGKRATEALLTIRA